MTNFKATYDKSKPKLLNDPSICKENRELFEKFFEIEEYKLKRKNNLRQLDNNCYSTLYDYIVKLKRVNIWFKNKPWKDLTREDIQKVYDDLEDGKIKRINGKPYENLNKSYYIGVFKSKPFELAGGKDEIARDVIQTTGNGSKEVRFITEDDFRKIVDNAYKPQHRLLFWLAWDIGENINALLQLRKKDFTRQNSPLNKEPEYRVNLKREILKRSRKPRSEITNYKETVKLLDQELAKLQDNELLFDYDYRNAKKILDRAVERSKVKCIPNGEKTTWKDLRSGMACDLLKKGYTSDEVNARLGHRPSSAEIDKYINFLALDRHTSKKKVHEFEMEKLNEEIERIKQERKLEAIRNETLQEQLKAQEEKINKMKEEQTREIIKLIDARLKSKK